MVQTADRRNHGGRSMINKHRNPANPLVTRGGYNSRKEGKAL